jgi:hypothetical protein
LKLIIKSSKHRPFQLTDYFRYTGKELSKACFDL